MAALANLMVNVFQALSEEEGSEDVEKDLWEDCLMNCLKHLCRSVKYVATWRNMVSQQPSFFNIYYQTFSWKHVDQMCLDQLASFEDSSASTTLQNAWNYPIYVVSFSDWLLVLAFGKRYI